MSGVDLFNAIIEATGVESSQIKSELANILENNNMSIEDLNINNLREIMAKYLIDSLPINNDC